MKKLFLLFMVTIMILTTACSSSEQTYTSTSTNTNIDPDKTPLNSQTQKDFEEIISEDIRIQSEVIIVTTADLVKAYAENQLAADKTYKGKQLEISGVIDEISVDSFMDVICVILRPTNSDKNLLSETVWCLFTNDKSDALSMLKVGDSVTISGTNEGHGRNYMNGIHTVSSIVISECEIANS